VVPDLGSGVREHGRAARCPARADRGGPPCGAALRARDRAGARAHAGGGRSGRSGRGDRLGRARGRGGPERLSGLALHGGREHGVPGAARQPAHRAGDRTWRSRHPGGSARGDHPGARAPRGPGRSLGPGGRRRRRRRPRRARHGALPPRALPARAGPAAGARRHREHRHPGRCPAHGARAALAHPAAGHRGPRWPRDRRDLSGARHDMAPSAADCFPPTYRRSRETLLAQASALARRHGVVIDSRSIDARGPEGETLAIDCCVFGARRPRRAVVVSSGLHGVEGFAGAALQHRLMARRLASLRLPADGAVIVMHALNPYGFAWLRRVNENNVDLNRNFRDEFDAEASEAYVALEPLLNPPDLHPASEQARLRALGEWVARHGERAFQQAVSEGQYRFPAGVQYGGQRHEAATPRILGLVSDWLGEAETVAWLDVHTGLGPWGEYQLLSASAPGSATLDFERSVFGDG